MKARKLWYTSNTLKGAAQTMGDREKEYARKCLDHWNEQCERMTRARPRNNAESIAFTIHLAVDERIEIMKRTSAHGADIQCRKGCASCCHLSVDVFPQEAVLLHVVAADQGIALDRAKLARQAKKTISTWSTLAPEDRRCVFLGDDNACKVYEHRPSACRKYQVKTPPDLCDVVKHPGGQVGIVFDVEAEIIFSASMTTYGAGTLAEMLLKHAPTNPHKNRKNRRNA